MMEISPALGREIFYIELWHSIALLAILSVNSCLYRNAEKNALLYRYLALQAGLLIWVVSKILKSAAPTVTLRWVFIVSQYFGICALGPFFFLFAWRYVFGRELKICWKTPLYLISFILFLLTASNPRHHLFYDSYTFYRDSFGPLFYVLSLYVYLLILAGTILFFYGMWRRHISGSFGDILIASSALLPLIINAAYTYRLFHPLFDYTPLFMTCSLASFGLAAFHSRFLGILPAAWKLLLLDLEDPLILTDRKGRVCMVSKLASVTSPRPEIQDRNRTYRLHRTIKDRKGTLYHYIDVTQLETLKNELQQKNRQIETGIEDIGRRNRETLELMKSDLLARSHRDLHDLLGHSLTQVIYLLRRNKQQNFFNTISMEERKIITRIIHTGLEHLTIRLEGKIQEGNSLSIALGELLRSCTFHGVSLEFLLRGNERPLPDDLVRELVNCSREGITNAVKHGTARRIDLVLLYGKKQIVLLLVDNGSGCRNWRDGTGLGLMRRSLNSFGGSLTIWSEPGEGFQLTLRIPYPADKSFVTCNE